MSNAHQHPGIILASLLRARSISPFALAEGTHLSFETISNILEGKQDIGSIDSTLIEAYLEAINQSDGQVTKGYTMLGKNNRSLNKKRSPTSR